MPVSSRVPASRLANSFAQHATPRKPPTSEGLQVTDSVRKARNITTELRRRVMAVATDLVALGECREISALIAAQFPALSEADIDWIMTTEAIALNGALQTVHVALRSAEHAGRETYLECLREAV